MVSLTAEPIFHYGSITITNTLLDAVFVDLVLFALIIVTSLTFKLIPTFFQNIIELVIQTFYDLTEQIAGERTKKIFPFFMSFFIFILIANWSELIPGFSSFGIKHGKEVVPLFRSLTSDLNATLALAIISAVATHIMSISTLGIKEYVSRYISKNPINLFVGMLEIIGEFTKIVSLSFRLFGNVFAGGVVLGIISGISALFVPIPFFLLEIIVGLVQALIFAMLTMVFMSILTTPHNAEAHVKERHVSRR
ncbi:MAG TPA: F0F1 ATP synthase subunit A [Patescibacteria group bacterium]|nr:F0F1 ATP synthase subunit A [Patescibacteria group bacterium]